MEKGETFLDAQNSEDYKKMYEDLKAYLEETKNLDVDKIHDFLDKYDGLDVDALNKYLETENEVTKEEADRMLSEKISNFVINNLGKNYTVKIGNKVSVVEFTSSSLTKIHFYTEGENGEKLHEVYREISDQFVTTYVKDVKLYSKISVDDAVKENNLLGFYNYRAIASVSADKTWEDILGNNNPNDYNDGFNYQCGLLEVSQYLKNGSMGEMTYDRFLFSSEEGTDTFVTNVISYDEGSDEDFEQLTTGKMKFEISDSSLLMSYYDFKIFMEGNPIPELTPFGEGRSFNININEEVSINFDKSEYRLVEDYLANPGL